MTVSILLDMTMEFLEILFSQLFPISEAFVWKIVLS